MDRILQHLEGIKGFVSQRDPARLWLSKPSIFVAWAGLALGVLYPANGFGASICWVQSATGIPCIGCGMTRSLSSGLHGMFAESWRYHPFGPFVLLLFLLTAVLSLAPATFHARIIAFMRRHASAFNAIYLAFATLFVGFGVARALAHLFHP